MHSTKNSLSLPIRKKSVDLLNQVIADLSDLYSQTKQAHWNVRGRLFIGLHKLFDELAGQVEEHIDPTAERLAALGGMPQGTVRQTAARSALPEFPASQANELSFLHALIDRYALVSTSVRKGIEQAADFGDADTADLLTGISRTLDQALWFLEAHNKE